MSKACQCDRCKSFFSIDTMAPEDKIARISRISTYDIKALKRECYLNVFDGIDLCPDCTDALLNLFMKDAMVDGERGFYAVDWKRDKEREEARKENKAEDEEDGV